MMTIKIKFKTGHEIALTHIDSCYLGEDDNMWRFFCDLGDSEIDGDTPAHGVEIDGDTIFVLHETIVSISFK